MKSITKGGLVLAGCSYAALLILHIIDATDFSQIANIRQRRLDLRAIGVKIGCGRSRRSGLPCSSSPPPADWRPQTR